MTLFGPAAQLPHGQYAEGRARMEAARRAAEAAIAEGGTHADPEWRQAALDIIRAFPPGRQFRAEEVVDALRERGVRTHDDRAMGWVVRDAQSHGWIEAVGWAPAASSHGSPKRLWERV